MGIEGLHPLLKSAIRRVDIKSAEFRGTTCAVDTSFLLHRGAYACAGKLAQRESTDRYVNYVIRYVERLLDWHIKPIMVFDGSPLPAKRITNINRSDERERNRLRAEKALASGKTREAEQLFQRAIEITPEMVLKVIQAIRTMGVDLIVAPYEADAQLAYLNLTNIVDFVLTEDSDLVLFGCQHIVFKLDETGHGELFERVRLDLKKEFGLDSFERFRWMCILSGCDYLDNITGIGLAKAKKVMSKTQINNIDMILKQLPQNLGMMNLRVTEDYIKGFKRAHLAFLHQIVYDPLLRKQVPLNPLPDDVDHDQLKFAGQPDDTSLAFQHAIGNLNVKTKCHVDHFDPRKWNYRPPGSSSSVTPAHLKSIWSSEYAVRSHSSSLTSTPVMRQTRSLPAIRPQSAPATTSTSDVISSSSILDLYLPASANKDIGKGTSAVEFHTSVIQSIEIVKRPRLFDQHDNDTSSRFFSSSQTTKTSIFDAINETNISSASNVEIDCISPGRHSKRFKRSEIDNEDSLPQLVAQTHANEFLTPIKHNRPILKIKSSNVSKEQLSMSKNETKTSEQESDNESNESSIDTSEPPSVVTIEAKSPVLQLPQHLRNRFAKEASTRMIRPI